jgi:predicted CxxxxCH...CXXCH cytochrome family protein
MSPITKPLIVGAMLLFCTVLIAGCGSSANSQAPFDVDTQQHPAGWLPAGHAQAAQADPTACTECHGSDLSGGISRVSCTPCHLNGSPFVLTNCTSCHGNPPAGTVAPSRAGAHAAHNSLPNVTNVCNTCHSGAGSGTLSHDNGTVDLMFLGAYNAKSGSAAYDAASSTCSKVSCHGGQTTPGWLSGATIDVNTQCTSCHAFGTAEYNSFVSGEHDFHVNTEHFPCEYCHDAAKLATGHFAALNTSAMEGPASATISGSRIVNYSNGSCTPLCHNTRTW